jgi:hypothetical protein
MIHEDSSIDNIDMNFRVLFLSASSTSLFWSTERVEGFDLGTSRGHPTRQTP